MKKAMKDIFLNANVQPEILHEFTILNYMIYHFCQKEWKLKKPNLLQIYMIKLKCHSHKKFKASIKSWISFERSS